MNPPRISLAALGTALALALLGPTLSAAESPAASTADTDWAAFQSGIKPKQASPGSDAPKVDFYRWAYLGRPWRDYASVLFMNTEMSEVVQPAGWHNWDRADREKTARFAEFNSQGRGAATANRVPWAGAPAVPEVQAVTANRVLAGRDHWAPAER